MQVSISPVWVGLVSGVLVADGVRDSVLVVLGLVLGRGRPLLTSTQYEFPILRPLQSYFTLGL